MSFNLPGLGVAPPPSYRALAACYDAEAGVVDKGRLTSVSPPGPLCHPLCLSSRALLCFLAGKPWKALHCRLDPPPAVAGARRGTPASGGRDRSPEDARAAPGATLRARDPRAPCSSGRRPAPGRLRRVRSPPPPPPPPPPPTPRHRWPPPRPPHRPPPPPPPPPPRHPPSPRR